MAAVTDEIFEKYLQKAIAETNELGDEIARAAGEGQVPVLGSGHPLADVFLLKHSPQPAEVQEGVAFYGRAGQALLKSLQRLNVDPLAIYGTNCFKLAGGDEDQARAWLIRELHIVQPKLVVVMGEAALEFLNAIEFPLADRLEPTLGELQRFTPTIQALYVPDIDESLDEAPAKTTLLERLQGAGPVVGRAAAVLSPRRVAAFVALAVAVGVYYGTHQLVVHAVALVGHRLARVRADPGGVRPRLARAAALEHADPAAARLRGRLRRRGGRSCSGPAPARSPTSRSSPR